MGWLFSTVAVDCKNTESNVYHLVTPDQKRVANYTAQCCTHRTHASVVITA